MTDWHLPASEILDKLSATPEGKRSFNTGDAIFIEAQTEHAFPEFSDDFATG